MARIDEVLFNSYPDSCGGSLDEIVSLLSRDELRGIFSLFYILPTLFQSDLDRGFSIISYDLNEEIASRHSLSELRALGVELKLDFVLNHLSMQSPQFVDLLAKGDGSRFVDMFIDWNKFWRGRGEIGAEGFVLPEEEYLSKLFMRKPGLPIMKLPFPDGSERYYWNTFYQDKRVEDGGVRYMGQMDLNGESELTWEFYEETLVRLKEYGARVVRLDAFAYLHKEPGLSNFFNEPGTWHYLSRLSEMASAHDLVLLPEIHSRYSDGTHRALSKMGYPFYDFFFPGLVLHTIETGECSQLLRWIDEIQDGGYQTVSMLGCHDGIPVLDVEGLLGQDDIDHLIYVMMERGGRVKELYGPNGEKIAYYQMNTTFYSAFGEDDRKLLLARAIQIFMPGAPLVWYLDLFAGINDYVAADALGHKEINRTNLSSEEIDRRLQLGVVKEQLKLLNFRSSFAGFGDQSRLVASPQPGGFLLERESSTGSVRLQVELGSLSYVIEYRKPGSDWQRL